MLPNRLHPVFATGLLLAGFLLPGPAPAQFPLRNLAPEDFPEPGNTMLVGATSVGPVFRADNAYGRELWVYDARGERALLLLDLNPGAGDSVAVGFTPALGKLFFVAGGPLPSALHVTDGTDPGTLRLAETGLGSSAEFDGALWFDESDGPRGSELWRSDGTVAGTGMVVDLGRLPNPVSGLDHFVAHRGRLHFTGQAGGVQLFSVDAQGGDLRNLTAFGPFSGSFVAGAPVPVGDELWFPAFRAGEGVELWSSDGTVAGTRLRVETAAGAASGFAVSTPTLQAFRGGVLFAGRDAATGIEPWFSDGTAAGTGPIVDLRPGAGNSVGGGQEFVIRGDRALFVADDGVSGAEPWITDGTAAGTGLLRDIVPGPLGSFPTELTATSAGFYFTARDTLRRENVWRSGGSPSTTDPLTIDAPERPARPMRYTEAAGRVWFDSDASFGGLWWSGNLVARPTEPLGAGADSDPQALLESKGELYVSFAFRNQLAGLLVTTGTKAGTRIVFGDGTAWPGDRVRAAIEFQGEVWFAANSDTLRQQWFITDGTEAGTRPAWSPRSVRPASRPFPLLFGDGLLFYGQPENTSEAQLVWTDGTETGTEVLTSFDRRNLGGSDADEPVVEADGSYVVFAGGPTRFASEPWVSDGTRAGTFELADIRPGSGVGQGSDPADFLVLQDRVVFLATSDTGRDLWITDGTRSGTRASGIVDGSSLSQIDTMTVADDTLWFIGRQGIGRWALHRFDLTSGVATRLFDLPAYTSQAIDLFSNGRGLLFFAVETFEEGVELWASDGTAPGTRQVSEGAPGPIPGYVRETAVAYEDSGFVLYAGVSAERGLQLWATDGTSANTFELGWVHGPGRSAGAARLGRPTVFAGGVLFGADAGFEGLEPWVLEAFYTGLPFVREWAPGCVGSDGSVPEQTLEAWPRIGETRFASTVTGGRPGAPAVLLASRGFVPRDFDGCGVVLTLPAEVAGATDLDTAGMGRATIGVPADVSLVGLDFGFQWAVLDEGAALAGLVALSDVEQVRIGR